MARSVTRPRTVARAAAGMGAVAAVSRGFGGIRVVVTAAVLGTTYLGNTFQSSNTFSTVLFELLAAGALSAVLVPTFVEHLDAGRQEDAEHLAGGVLGVAVLVLGGVAVVGVLAAPWLADVLTSQVDDPTVAAQQRELTIYLLYWFVPQIVLYGVGAVSTAVLHARRRFSLPAAAPIGNTVVLVAFLLAFRAVAGPDPGLELTSTEKLLLGLGGTAGVLAFVATPTVAVLAEGFRLRPRLSGAHQGLRRLLQLSGWATVQHAGAGILLGAAIVAGGAVEGGVLAYQVAFYFFLAPYGIIAQPIHTAILPELVGEAGDRAAFGSSLRWALDSMTVLLVPLSALFLALSVPLMRILAFGGATDGVDLLAAAMAALGLGLLPYGGFLLLARAFYSLDNSRLPAIASIVSAVLGAALMFILARGTDGSALVFSLGLSHSIAFTVGSTILVLALHRRIGEWAVPSVLPRVVAVSAVLGLGAWLVMDRWDPTTKIESLLALVVVGTAATAAYVGAVRLLGISITERMHREPAT
jgi:putative peptidoglycan lipid II flippase